jgi:hypothetical protein
MLRLLVAALLTVVALAPAQAAVCSQADIQRAAEAVTSARDALGAFVIRDDSDPSIPPRAQGAIVTMKTRLAQLAGAYMRCAPEGLSANMARRELAALVHAGAPKAIDRYGQQVDVAVTRAPLHFVTVTLSFNVKCATDDVTSIFADEGGIWRERMRIRNGRYKDAAGATGGLETRISLPDNSGNWFVAAKSIAPWCSSTWSLIRYAVLRPTDDPLSPGSIFHAQDSIWWGGEDFGRLSVDIHGFDLRFHAESIDPARHSREWVRDFSVVGDTVTRTPLIALGPRDFMEEWIQSKWADARGWTLAAAAPRLRKIHERLHAEPYAEYKSIHRCGRGLLQFEIRQTEAERSDYLLVSGNTDFTMMDVSPAPDRRCTGENLYDPGKPGEP